MRSWLKCLLLAAGLLAASAQAACDKGASSASQPAGAVLPELPVADATRWVNGSPQTLAAARGSVVLVEVWHPA